jgi:hypothetical protein
VDRITITLDDVSQPERLRTRLDQAFAQNQELLRRLTALESSVPTQVAAGAISPQERLLLQQLSIGSTDNPAASQTPVFPLVDSLPPPASSTPGEGVILKSDGRVYWLNGATLAWVPIGSAAPADMLTTDTNQAIPTAVKTWGTNQVFNGGLTAGGTAALAAVTASGGVAISGGQLASAVQFGAWVYASAAQSIPNTTLTALLFDTESYDIGGMHSAVSNTSRLVVPAGGAGRWLPGAFVTFAASAVGSRSIILRGNGAVQIAQATIQANTVAAALTAFFISTPAPVFLADGDYIEVLVTQDSGGALNANAGLGVTGFGMVKMF